MNLKLTKSQKKAWKLFRTEACKELVLCWSRQAGKSVFAELVVVYCLLNYNDANIGYITPQFAHSRKVYNDLLRLLQPTSMIKSANSSVLQIETVNGSKISFFSAESPTALRGNTFKRVVIFDEVAFIPDTTSSGEDFFYNICMPTWKANKRFTKVLYISTPRGKQGFFYTKYMKGIETYKKSANVSNRVYSIKATIYDDSLMSEEDIEEIKNTMPEQSFRQEFMCEFLDTAMSAFSDYADKFNNTKPIDFNSPLWIGVDFHSVGSDSTIVTLMDRDNNVWQYDIKGELDWQYRQIADIVNKCKRLVIAYMESNSIGAVMINEIKKLVKNQGKVIEWTTTNETKENEVGLVQGLISKDMIHFENGNTELKKQFDTFGFNITKNRKVTYAAINGMHDDRVLSLMICMQAKEDYNYSNGNNIVFIKSASARMDMR